MAVLINPSIPANNLKELVAFLKANPGKYNYASAGAGTVAHLFGELLKLSQGLDLVHVPFAGSEPAIQSALAGHADRIRRSHACGVASQGREAASACGDDACARRRCRVPTVADAGCPTWRPTSLRASWFLPVRQAVIDLLYREVGNVRRSPT
jgi:tripartite-type tricarboxylate transporter receptor subunit TctC